MCMVSVTPLVDYGTEHNGKTPWDARTRAVSECPSRLRSILVSVRPKFIT